jgi:RNA polymerase sigma-70 factor (ECF subfamily)
MRNTFLNSVHRANPIVYLDDMSYNGSFAASMVSQQSSDRNLDLQDIYNAIDSLPASRSEVVYLLILGHKYDEIANILDIPTGTVKSRINASRNELRKILEDYFK